MASLEINPEKVSYLIALAREIKDALPSDGSAEDESHRGEVIDLELIPEHAYDANYQELAGFLATLDDDELAALVAILWVGRGTFDGDELEAAVSEARIIGAQRIPGYLLSQSLLAEYLEEGMTNLGLTPEEI